MEARLNNQPFKAKCKSNSVYDLRLTPGKVYSFNTKELYEMADKKYNWTSRNFNYFIMDDGIVNRLSDDCMAMLFEAPVFNNVQANVDREIQKVWAKPDPYTAHRNKLVVMGIEVAGVIQPIKKVVDNSHYIEPTDLLADDTGPKRHE